MEIDNKGFWYFQNAKTSQKNKTKKIIIRLSNSSN